MQSAGLTAPLNVDEALKDIVVLEKADAPRQPIFALSWRALSRKLLSAIDLKAAVAFFCLVLIAANWYQVIMQSQNERALVILNAIKQNANLARAFEEHALLTIKGVDSAALFVAGEYARLGAKTDLRQYVEDGYIDDSLVDNIYIINEHGDLVLSLHSFKPGNFADREHFKVHVAQDTRKLFINKPLLGRTSNKWTIHMSRRITKPDGSFGGIVSMAVDPGYFSYYFQQTDLGQQGLVNLVGFDGISRARIASGVHSFGQVLTRTALLQALAKNPNGDFLTTGVMDVPRYLSYRTIPGYPLLVAVGRSEQEVLAGYIEERNSDYRGAAEFTVVILIFAALLIAALARQARTVRSLVNSAAQFRATFNQAAIGISHTALDGRFLQVNQKLCDMVGYTHQELLVRTWQDITHHDDLGTSDAHDLAQLGGDGMRTGLEKRYLHKDGSTVWTNVSTALVRDDQGQPEYFVNMIEGIAERKQMQQSLLHLAHHDNLTGLPNRELYYDRLDHALSQATRRNWNTGVLFIDLDAFKVVNDTLGHGVGDELLRHVAKLLLQCVRDDDTVGRLGGDEFAVVLSELALAQDAGTVAQKILDALSLPIQLDEHEVLVTASIGIKCAPPGSTDADALVSEADAAMYEAKRAGKNRYRFYTAGTNEEALRKIALTKELRLALANDEFVLHYQPKANIATGQVTGVEALLRWQRPGGALVPPADFVPLLEEAGLIVPTGEWVLRTACAQIRSWLSAGVVPVPIAVNLSARQFHEQDICESVSRAMREFQVAPALLELEVTESAAMQNVDQTAATLHELKALGLRVSIDDFGTGHSSLSYLKSFPIDSLKIDRSFVTELPSNEDDATIAKTVITMAHALRLKVIAEGVETAAQLEFLAAHGCEEIQGYYFSRPLPSTLCTELLRQGRTLVRTSAVKFATSGMQELTEQS